VDPSDNIYVAANHRIQKFNPSGAFLAKWGNFGTSDGQFKYPRGISADSSSNIYVVDSGNSRIQKFDSSGTFLAKWGSQGTGNGQFQYPYGIEVDSSGNVYVADSSNNRIQKFSYRENTPPVADAGFDRIVLVNGVVTMDGNGSYDPDEDSLSYVWDFGDSAMAAGVVVTHVYTAADTYTTTLTVTDDNGAIGTDTAIVTVLTAAEAIELLILDVMDLNLQQGIENGLDAKLDSAFQALDDLNEHNNVAAVNALQAFINAVEAQRGTKIPNADADDLIDAANAIITALGGS
jgi:hypothetical protein